MMGDDDDEVKQQRELGGDRWTYGESNTEIRRLGWLLTFFKNLDASNPSEAGRNGFDENEIFYDADG